MGVVPRDELGRGPRAREVFSGNAESLVGLGSERVDDRVVELHELVVL
jgi:hypothetical protein